VAALKAELIERIAHLVVAETPVDQIGIITGLTAAEVILLKDKDECKRQVAVIMGEQIEEAQNLNNGWDAVENQAIGIVLDNLRWNKDPKFALAAAAQANRAVRRGRSGNQALNASNGARAVINLQMNFVKMLENSTQKQVEQNVQFEKKMIDCLEPTKIEAMLEPAQSPADDDEALPGFDLIAGAAE
jgi:hypothetical protein